VPQSRALANPPTLLLALDALLDARGRADGEARALLDAALRAALPALERWFGWLRASQAAGGGGGGGGGGFYWRGRSASDGKLNAMTLASGLDDYPRATQPDASERHLDLLCWLAAGARALARAARALGAGASTTSAGAYEALHAELVGALRPLHWDGRRRRFADVGLTANEGALVEHVVVRCARADGDDAVDADAPLAAVRRARARSPCPPSHPRFLWPLGDGAGGLLTRARWRPSAPAAVGFVDHVGYVTLFPLALRLLAPDDEALGATLEVLRDPAQLWGAHGLRSLSRADRLYGVGNGVGDAAYWRGPVWLNVNYLVLGGLHHYGERGQAAHTGRGGRGRGGAAGREGWACAPGARRPRAPLQPARAQN
jgi:mannosyl-oligosaccharide glucosidase